MIFYVDFMELSLANELRDEARSWTVEISNFKRSDKDVPIEVRSLTQEECLELDKVVSELDF